MSSQPSGKFEHCKTSSYQGSKLAPLLQATSHSASTCIRLRNSSRLRLAPRSSREARAQPCASGKRRSGALAFQEHHFLSPGFLAEGPPRIPRSHEAFDSTPLRVGRSGRFPRCHGHRLGHWLRLASLLGPAVAGHGEFSESIRYCSFGMKGLRCI